MRKKLFFLLASTMMTVGASAVEWEKPVPVHQDLVYGDTVYLYNRDGKGFFLGGNTYGTHASIGPEGYKCIFENTEMGVTFRDSVESKSKWFNVYAHFETGDCWVDWAENGDIYFDVVKQDDGSYQIFSHSSFNTDMPLGIDANGDNLTYVKFTDPEFAAGNYISWWIVSQEAYAKYWVDNSIYENALALEKKISEAADLGLNDAVVAATAVYENTAATLDEMKAANETLQAAINDYKENQVTPDKPQDLTETYIPDADFESNSGAGVWQRTHSAQNYQTNGTAGKLGDQTTFLEAWNKDPYSGKEYVPITGLPNGVYEFTLSAATNNGSGCYVYAGNSRVEVTSGNMTSYTVYAQVTDGNLEVGLDMPKAIQNWVGIDDAKLVYLGNSVASYAYWVKNVIDNSPEYDEDTFAQISLVEAYNGLRETDLSKFTTIDEILAFNEQFAAAQANLDESLAAYAKFQKILNQIKELEEAGYEGAAADELFESYDNGDINTIASERKLTAEEIAAKGEEVNKALDVVKKTCLVVGHDCTNLLVNPNFDEHLTGWEHDKTMADGKVDGLASNLNAERWNDNFDFYQVVTGVPNGVYELRVQAFYRPTDDTKTSYDNFVNGKNDEILASIYVNSLTAPVKNIAEHTYDENLEGNCTDLGNGLYCPNGQTSASNAFTRGDYENVVRGIVTDGVLKVGIKSKGTIEGRWTLWDNFRLKFLGKDAEAAGNAVTERGSDADKYSSPALYAYSALKEAVDAAYAKALSATGDEKFAALCEFVQALDEAKENAALYEEIKEQKKVLDDAIEKTVSTSEELVNASKKLSQDLQGGYEDLLFTTAEARAMLEKAYNYSAKLRLPDYNGASEEDVKNFTSVIVNPSFEENKKDEEGLKGWVNEGSIKMKAQDNTSFGKTDNVYCEKWHANGSINLHQTLKYLPNGYYTLSVDAFCQVDNAVIFANDKEIPFSNKEDAEHPATETITLQVTDGTLTFGIRVELTDETWVCVDNFQLFYYGETVPTAIDEVAAETAADATASEFFTVSGARADKLGKGINIVRMSDGTVKKVFVK